MHTPESGAPHVHAGLRSGARTAMTTLAIVVWSIVFLATCGRAGVVKTSRNSVYPVFVSAGGHWLKGEALYVRGSVDEFRYSPLVAAFFAPFNLLPLRAGDFLWRTLNFGLFVTGLLYCCAVGLPRRLAPNEAAAVFLLVIPLAIGSLNNAQSNPLVIGLMLIAVASVMGGRWTLAAAAVTVATCFKLYPIALGLLLAVLQPKRFAWRLLVCLAVGALLPFILQRAGYVIEQYSSWSRYLVTEDRQNGPIGDWYRDFRAVWRLYIGRMSARHYLLIELAAAAAIAAIVLLGRLQRWPQNVLLIFVLGLGCCWMTVLGPATESPTYVLLAPSIAWMLVWLDDQTAARPWRIAYGVVFALFTASQAALWFGSQGKWFRDRIQPLPIAGSLMLFVLLIDAARRLVRPLAGDPEYVNAPPANDR